MIVSFMDYEFKTFRKFKIDKYCEELKKEKISSEFISRKNARDCCKDKVNKNDFITKSNITTKGLEQELQNWTKIIGKKFKKTLMKITFSDGKK